MSTKILPFLPSALEREVEAALIAAKIYKVDSYGWLNENDPDPEYIGHAMWQTDQPYINYSALFGDEPVVRRPDEIEKQILTTGEDFCGLMEASRLSIGLVLIWAPHARLNVLAESKYFWLHHLDAFMKLAIASDRLRDLLVIACTGDMPEVFKNVRKQNKLYATAFMEAETLLTNRGLKDPRLTESLHHLSKVAHPIFANIDRRNAIVHEVATRMAKMTQDSVATLQQQYDNEQSNGFKPKLTDPADWMPQAQEREMELGAEFDNAIAELVDWYKLLIDASNSVFQVEYWSRVLGNK